MIFNVVENGDETEVTQETLKGKCIIFFDNGLYTIKRYGVNGEEDIKTIGKTTFTKEKRAIACSKTYLLRINKISGQDNGE